MARVQNVFRTVAKVTEEGNIISLKVQTKLQFWLVCFDPKQGTCFLSESDAVYRVAVRALREFVEDIEGDKETRREVALQVAVLDCLKGKAGSHV